jgi:uncharacterized protein
MYNLQDRTWRNQPAVMSSSITRQLGRRINEHARTAGLRNVHVILHGGEPLLLGKKRLSNWVQIVREEVKNPIATHFSIQSNGVLIDDAWVRLLHRLNVRIGLSVDGPKEYHDKYRVDHFGNGSFQQTVDAIRLLRRSSEGQEIFSTVMAVVDPNIPPKTLFAFWNELDVPGFDLSLPHANHSHPPPSGELSYGDWLVQFFDLWFDQNRSDRHVRYFENIIRCIFNYPISTDNIGGRPVGVVVIETDGGIEPTDAFKCCEDSLTKVGYNIASHRFDDVWALPFIQTLQVGARGLCDTCNGCDVKNLCGGGYMPHRYRRGASFQNPSVYCNDLYRLTHHIYNRVVGSIQGPLRDILVKQGRMVDA